MSPVSPTAINAHRSVPLPNQVNRTPSLAQSILNNNSGWSAICLRPSPPLRPCLALGNNTPHGSPLRSNKLPLHDEDSKILQVIEAYCSLAKPKNPNTGQYYKFFFQSSSNKNLLYFVKNCFIALLL